MDPRYRAKLEERVGLAADAALAAREVVTPIDVLIGVGWLSPAHVDMWRQGRIECLEEAVQVDSEKLSTAMTFFRRWVEDRDLAPTEATYVARTRDRRALRFSATGDPATERDFGTHWLPSEMPPAKRRAVEQKASTPPELVVVSPLKDWECAECSGTGDLLIMEGDGPLCMRCADLDHLVYLPAGDATLTRRAKKASRLSAVVVRFSRSRRRYERQGILVEEDALAAAEESCLADEEARLRRRERDAERRVHEDADFQAAFAAVITALFPRCPPERADAIARRAAARGSGRVGRSAAGRALEPNAVELGVLASVRHLDTGYDELLMSGLPRAAARVRVQDDVQRVLDSWRAPVLPG